MITDLGFGLYPAAINASGQVTGSDGAEVPWVYSGGTLTYLNLGNASANGINASGQVVGQADGYAYLYSAGTTTNLGTLGLDNISNATGINNAGQIVGSSYGSYGTEPGQAFLYSGGVMTAIAGTNSWANAINSSGLIVGDNSVAGEFQAFLYSEGILTELGTLGGVSSDATGINDSGQVVGTFYAGSESGPVTHAFLYSGGAMADLGTLDGSGDSYAYGINSSGEVVGTSNDVAFLYANGVMTSLNSLLPAGSGWNLEQASAINDSGQIVGYGIGPDGHGDAFLLDVNAPEGASAPEPSTIAMLIGGIAALLLMRKRIQTIGARL